MSHAQPSSDESQESTSSSAGVPAFGLAAMVVYVLSPVPALWLLSRLPPTLQAKLGEPFETVANLVYLPLQWLRDNVEFVDSFYDWYLARFVF